MVGWVQPSNTTKRVVSITLVGIAIIATLVRLRTRIRTRRFWLDDVWVILALCCSSTMIASIWLRSNPSQSRSTVITAYWIGTLGFTNTLWASRMSVMFSVIRLVPHDNRSRLRKITNWFAALFALCWMGLLIQKVHLCASDKSWYKGHFPQQCPLSTGAVVFQLVADVFADGTLFVLPLTLIRHAIVPGGQRKMLIVIFAACLLTTLVSIVHAVLLLGRGGSLEGVTVQAEAATALFVANVGVLVSFLPQVGGS